MRVQCPVNERADAVMACRGVCVSVVQREVEAALSGARAEECDQRNLCQSVLRGQRHPHKDTYSLRSDYSTAAAAAAAVQASEQHIPSEDVLCLG